MVKAVRSTVRDLIGANILTETDTEITIKYLLDTSSISIRQSIVQLQYARLLPSSATRPMPSSMPSTRMSEFTTELTKHDDPQKWSHDTSHGRSSHTLNSTR